MQWGVDSLSNSGTRPIVEQWSQLLLRQGLVLREEQLGQLFYIPRGCAADGCMIRHILYVVGGGKASHILWFLGLDR